MHFPAPRRPFRRQPRALLRAILAGSIVGAGLVGASVAAGSAGGQASTTDQTGDALTGAVILRQPEDDTNTRGQSDDTRGTSRDRATTSTMPDQRDRPPTRPQVYQPSPFEIFARRVAGEITLPNEIELRADRKRLRRFGADLMLQGKPDNGQAPNQNQFLGNDDYASQIPPDYVLKAGDEVVVTLWGAVDANLRLVVDRSGRITIPRVGPVLVAGVRYADLSPTIEHRVAQVFRNFQLSVALGKLRSMRIYLTGFVEQPGSYTVSSLSTLVNVVVRGGGPSAAGSFRNISVQRAGKTVTTFDFYDLLLRGDKSHDLVLEPEDVVNVGPIGTQVAMVGSVNRPAIFELKPGETIRDVLAMAGGFDAVADRNRVAIERLANRSDIRVSELAIPAALDVAPGTGDVLKVFSAVEASVPLARQNTHIVVDGEVNHPGDYVLPAGSHLSDAIAAAGGLTREAFLFGAEFTRESVRKTQQENFDRAIRDMELELARNAASSHGNSSDEAAAATSRFQASTRLLTQLRQIHPTGRMTLVQDEHEDKLPNIGLEEQDHLYIPPQPTTVGVFGSVYNTGTYLFVPGHTVGNYLNLAGGPTAGADAKKMYVLRPNGTVAIDDGSSHSWFSSGNNVRNREAHPGDTVFVPEDWDKTTFTDSLRAWTQILYQAGLGAAAIKVLSQ